MCWQAAQVAAEAAEAATRAGQCETNAAEPKIAFPLWKLRKLPQRRKRVNQEKKIGEIGEEPGEQAANHEYVGTSPDNWQKCSIKV